LFLTGGPELAYGQFFSPSKQAPPIIKGRLVPLPEPLQDVFQSRRPNGAPETAPREKSSETRSEKVRVEDGAENFMTCLVRGVKV
jgi:hypothetical protein